MHILMTTDTVGGVFVYCVELCRALTARGHTLTLVSLGRAPTRAQRAKLHGLPGLQLEVQPGLLEWMDDPWRDVDAAGQRLLQLAQRDRPDCIHLNDFAHGALEFQAPVLMVGHSCVLSWWQAVHARPAPQRYARYRQRVQRGLQGAQRVIAPSRAMLGSLQAFYGPLPDARVVPNGIDLRAFAPRVKQPWVLSAGRLWDEAKNVRALTQIAERLAFRVYLAGESRAGADRDAALSGCRPLGLVERDALRRWLGHAAIYALPARYEPFGLSVLEAAAAGCALVLGEIDSLRENWSQAACFVPPNDPEAVCDSLTRLIADESARRAFGERARLRAQRFDSRSMAAAYEGHYAQLVDTGARRSEQQPALG